VRSLLALLLAAAAWAEDWPEWRGAGRRGEWRESGILEKFPAEGLKIRWRTPIRSGFAGPSVSRGRVYVTDFQPVQNLKGIERVLCLDEKTGKILWTQQWETDYVGLMRTYAIGPRATPTVDGDRVYVQGAKGVLASLNANTGALLWKKDYVADYKTDVPVWGMTSAPLVDGNRLIVVAGGQPDAKVMAFDKMTGAEIWRALSSEKAEPGYAQPLMVEAGGTRQLILWHPLAVTSLDPATGKVYWEQPFAIRAGMTVATPVQSGLRLLVSAFYNGPMMFELSDSRPAAKVLWKGSSDSEVKPDKLHALLATPVIDGDYIYGICSYGHLRCLKADTGEQVWETLDVTRERARWAAAFLVRHGDRYFINNDRGELIVAKLSHAGYQEISRTQLIKPTSNSGNRREAGAVHWSHPAYANRHILTRNDEEILSASLEK